jgi:hypothetical protein
VGSGVDPITFSVYHQNAKYLCIIALNYSLLAYVVCTPEMIELIPFFAFFFFFFFFFFDLNLIQGGARIVKNTHK